MSRRDLHAPGPVTGSIRLGKFTGKRAFGGMSKSLAQSIADCIIRRSGDTILTICAKQPGQAHERLSGEDLHRASLARAAMLSERFDPAAGPLAMVMPCGSDFVTTMIGALYAGFTIAPLAPPRPGAQTERFNRIVSDCRPAAILCSEGFTPRLDAARRIAGGREVPIVPIPSNPAQGATAMSHPIGSTRSDRPAILQYTSGSTRAPRGVILHGDTILANAALANRTWGMDEHGTMLSWLPHFHDMGLMGGILYPLLSGGVTALMDPLQMIQRPHRWLQLIGELRATFSGGPAFAFARCLDCVTEDQCATLDLSSWRAAFCGAEPVPAALIDAFRRRFAPYGLDPRALFASYGLAEHTLMVAGGAHQVPAGHRPPPGCEAIEPCRVADEMRDKLRIVDPQSRRALGEGVLGEVWLRGQSVAQGYLGNGPDSARAFEARLVDDSGAEAAAGAWLRTGDLAILDKGYLYVTGRLKDLLFVNGQKVAASDVEWLAARQHPALNPMAAAALMPDDMRNGEGILLIETRRRSMAVENERAVHRKIAHAVAGSWSIELTRIHFLPPNTLPRTTSGKVQRRLALQAYREGAFFRAAAA
jgi:acyl-CoA synthetase (AMP-forming)/AMP-acid ligase II